MQKYVSLLGIERCGKGTQIEMLKTYYRKKLALKYDGYFDNFNGHDKFNEKVLNIREPGTTAIGTNLRAWMKPSEHYSVPIEKLGILEASAVREMKTLTPESYFHMMMFQREVLQKYIRSDENKNKFIISDRNHFCTYAYQLTAQDLRQKTEYKDMWLNRFEDFFKDLNSLNILIDITPEESLKRKFGRASTDAFDEASLNFMQKVRNGYKGAAVIAGARALQNNFLDNYRFVEIDGSRSKEEVHEDIVNAVNTHLNGFPE